MAKHILNDQVFTKSTTNQLYCRKKEWKEKQNKKWMVLFITYLRPSLQKEKKTRPWSPPNKTLSRLTTTTDWPYQFVLAFKTVHYSAQHFLNFFVKQHHHRSRHWQNNNKFGISSSKIKTTTNTAAASAHTERMEFGRGLNNWSCPALYRNY